MIKTLLFIKISDQNVSFLINLVKIKSLVIMMINDKYNNQHLCTSALIKTNVYKDGKKKVEKMGGFWSFGHLHQPKFIRNY